MDIYELYKIRKKRITAKRLSQLRHDGHITEEEYQELKDMYRKLEQEPVLDKIRAEIEKQEKWLLQAGYTTYNVDIAFDAIKAVVAESEDQNADSN